jgi:Ca-activated chloride channel family protein
MRPALLRPVFAVLAVLVALVAPAALSAQGMLIPRDEALRPLELTSHRVSFEITDNGAVTHVTQVFTNHTAQQLEATYYFSIPEGAVTTDFALWMNGERITGEVMPRGEARAIYEGIVRRMRDPGLLEWVTGDLFQASIFPILPHSTQTVEIEYASVLARDGNMLRFTYPMHESAGSTVDELVISGTVRAATGIASLYSPRHEIDVVEETSTRSRVAFEQTNGSTGSDFDLFIGLTDDDVGFSFLAHDPDDNEDGYFMMTLSPSSELDSLEVLPKQVTFVIDTSGSMAGVKMTQAREMLSQVVDALREGDNFNIVSFSTGVNAAFEQPVEVNRTNLREAHEFIDGLVARGNTNISGALERALQDEASSDRPHVVVFITDGLPTEGDTDVDDIIAIAREGVEDVSRRVFTFGVGYDVNTRLLDGIARRGRGQSGYVRPEEQMGDVVGTFFAGVDAPLLTDLELDFGRARVSELYPNPLPDLYRGNQVTVFGRFSANASEPIEITGRAGRERVTLTRYPEWDDAGDADKSFIGNLWARRRVDDLLAQIDEEGHTQSRVDEIVSLATRWGIVTPYTSYLAVDPSEQQFANQIRDQFVRNEDRDNAPGRVVTRGGPPMDEAEGWADMPLAAAEAPMGGLSAGDGFGSGGGRATRISGSAQASRPAAAPAPAPRADTGREAVEESLRRQRETSATTVSNTAVASRSVAGRAFTNAGGIWIESGLENETPDRTIATMSDEYFALLSDHPELAEVLALGERVRFRLGREVIEIR